MLKCHFRLTLDDRRWPVPALACGADVVQHAYLLRPPEGQGRRSHGEDKAWLLMLTESRSGAQGRVIRVYASRKEASS